MNIRHLGSRTLGVIAVAAIAVAMIGGCKNAESAVVGDWKDAKGDTLTFKSDKTVSQGSGTNVVGGKWSLAEKKVTMTIETLGGKPAEKAIDDQIAQVEKQHPGIVTPALKAQAKQILKGFTFVLAEDGKTMTLNGPDGKALTGGTGTLTKVDAK